MPTSSSGLTWLIFALLTVGAWGLYGILLHTGQIAMGDPENGRYKAYLFVGIACRYWISHCTRDQRGGLVISDNGADLVAAGWHCGGNWCVWRTSRLWSEGNAARGYVHCFCWRAYGQCDRLSHYASASRWMGRFELAICVGYYIGRAGGVSGDLI